MTATQIILILLAVGFIIFLVWSNKEARYDELERRIRKGETLKGKDGSDLMKRQGTRKQMKADPFSFERYLSASERANIAAEQNLSNRLDKLEDEERAYQEYEEEQEYQEYKRLDEKIKQEKGLGQTEAFRYMVLRSKYAKKLE